MYSPLAMVDLICSRYLLLVNNEKLQRDANTLELKRVQNACPECPFVFEAAEEQVTRAAFVLTLQPHHRA